MTKSPIADRMPALQMDAIAMSFGPVQAVTDGNLSLHWGRVTALLGGERCRQVDDDEHPWWGPVAASGSIRLDGFRCRCAAPAMRPAPASPSCSRNSRCSPR